MVRDADAGKRACNDLKLVPNVMGKLFSMLYHIRATLTKMEPLTPKLLKKLRQMSLKTILKTSLKFTSGRKTTMKRKKMMKIINRNFFNLYSIVN